MKGLLFLFMFSIVVLNIKSTTLFNCSTHSYIASTQITSSEKNYNEIALDQEILTLLNMRNT